MTVDQLINLLAATTLIEMMVTIGLGVTVSDVLRVSKSWGLVARALLANYILVPGAAVGLLVLFHANPMVAAGFLVAAVCPGAPYGPPFTVMAKGNATLAVGLMVILAASSAIIAPLLLRFLLPLVAGNTALNINVFKMVGTLLGAQLLQFRMLREIRLRGYLGMLCLVIASMAAGRLMGGRPCEGPKGMVLTTSVRNVGVSLVIATGSFPGTAAITSATAYALFQTIVIACVALAWGRLTPGITLVKKKAA